MNPRNVLQFPMPDPSGLTPETVGYYLTSRFFNGRNGTVTSISRDELQILLAGAARIALDHCTRRKP